MGLLLLLLYQVVLADEVCLLQNQKFLDVRPDELDNHRSDMNRTRQRSMQKGSRHPSLRRTTEQYIHEREPDRPSQVAATWKSGRHHIGSSNLIFLKIPKTGSSTMSGVARRIASHHGLSGYEDSSWITREPGVWANHANFRHVYRGMQQTLKLPAFVFTNVREPAARCLSNFYHVEVSINGVPDSAESKIKFLNSSQCISFQYNYMRREQRKMSVKDVLASYDFVGVLEQAEESMVVLADILNVSLTDVLFISAKLSDQQSTWTTKPGEKQNHTAVPHRPLAQEPAAVREYVTNEFRKMNPLDYDLYDTVRSRLNQQMLTHKFLQERVIVYKDMHREVKERCANTPDTKRDCYWNDNGCGIACIDNYARTFVINSPSASDEE